MQTINLFMAHIFYDIKAFRLANCFSIICVVINSNTRIESVHVVFDFKEEKWPMTTEYYIGIHFLVFCDWLHGLWIVDIFIGHIENWSLLFEVCNHVNHSTSQFTCAFGFEYFHSQTSNTKLHQSIAFLTKQSIYVAKLLLVLLLLCFFHSPFALLPHSSSSTSSSSSLVFFLIWPNQKSEKPFELSGVFLCFDSLLPFSCSNNIK